MTTVPVRHGAVGVAPVRHGVSPLRRLIALEARAEAGLKVFLQRWSIPALRVALGGVFVVFGALKFVPGMSPLEALVQSTWEKLSFGLVGGQRERQQQSLQGDRIGRNQRDNRAFGSVHDSGPGGNLRRRTGGVHCAVELPQPPC